MQDPEEDTAIPTDPMELILRVWADLEAELNRALQEPIADSEFFPGALERIEAHRQSLLSKRPSGGEAEELPVGENTHSPKGSTVQ